MKLTKPQYELLEDLPDSPSDGRFCKGSRLNIARHLVEKRLAKKIVGGWFVRTPAGAAALRAADGFDNFPRLSETPCPRCLELARNQRIRIETVQRLPDGLAAALLARDGSGKCCFDCASADALMTGKMGLTFEMARIAVGNERQEQYRLPGALMGLVKDGLVRASKVGDLKDQHTWLDRMRWFDLDREVRQ